MLDQSDEFVSLSLCLRRRLQAETTRLHGIVACLEDQRCAPAGDMVEIGADAASDVPGKNTKQEIMRRLNARLAARIKGAPCRNMLVAWAWYAAHSLIPVPNCNASEVRSRHRLAAAERMPA